ncbi:NleD-like pathogen effector protein (putative zinc metallopeptidase) [Haloactinopolyspora alba]|uniref:NleD-like pathogen effector protein (Putative zinc metallopeptidase) n=1 Tax=Haloactinopolyspora alba TaxID=648780 RepID=A0A2P8DY56_9ACTN|nr:M91 family zinc metallopeptidase [Haloactinopolyspora alba]PSL02160.1 NleD-like pathogen effector protein (putative zinc metallopeptidase) [Haloactinopolyspora alba]
MSLFLDDVWDLGADIDYLYTAGTAWANLATDLGNESTAIGNREEELRLNWQCSMADSYFEHASRLSKAFGNASDISGGVADILTKLKDDVRDAEDELSASFARATADAGYYYPWPGKIYFFTDEDEATVLSEHEKAQGILDTLSERIRAHKKTLEALAGDAAGIKRNWAAAAAGDDPGWDIPTGSTYGVQVTSLDGTTAVTTGDGSETVEVTVDPDTGETIVTITDAMGNETVERVPAGNEVVINTGKGDDEITVPRGTNVNVRFATGAGDDTVSAQGSEGDVETFGGDGVDTLETGVGDDYVSGGGDSDYVDGGAGNDVLTGRLGNDTVYGMDGTDVIAGGSGQDYLEGAKGNDTVFGGADGDVVSGGYGDDDLFGGDGGDRMYAGGGDDAVDGGRGAGDEAFVEAGDDTAGRENSVVVEIPPKEEYLRWLEIETSGSPEFQDRVLADLAMMASSPVGQKMLERQGEHYDNSDNGWFDFSKEKVTIREHAGGNNSASFDGDEYAVALDVNHTSQGYPMDYDDPNYDVTPPNVFFFHELGHINQYRSGESDQFYDSDGDKRKYSDGTPLIERQNVGLEWDADGDGDEEIDPEYDFDYTENGFREELGLPSRNQY